MRNLVTKLAQMKTLLFSVLTAAIGIVFSVNADVTLVSEDPSSLWTQDGNGVWSSPGVALGGSSTASFTATNPCLIKFKYRFVLTNLVGDDKWESYFQCKRTCQGNEYYPFFSYPTEEWTDGTILLEDVAAAENTMSFILSNNADCTATAYIKEITVQPIVFETIGALTWFYVASGNNAAIVTVKDADGNSPSCDVTVPATLASGSLSVTEIVDEFLQYGEATGLTIPNSVTKIGSLVAFQCWQLASVQIGAGVASIGADSFFGGAIQSITVASANAYYASYAGALYNKAKTVLLTYPAGKSSFELAPTTTDIADYACQDLSIASITIPSSVRRIGEYSFAGSMRLSNVVVEEGVTVIGDGAFSGVGKLKSVQLPNTLKDIGDFAFEGSWGLSQVNIPNSVTNIGDSAFANCERIQLSSLSTNLVHIGKEAFEYCYGLTKLVVPNSVETIDESAFMDCSGLQEVYLPNKFQATLDVEAVFGTYFDADLITWYSTLPYHTVTLDANYSGGAQIQVQMLKYMERLPVPAARTGYVFAGWWDDRTDENYSPDVGDEVTGNVTYYAHWATTDFTFGGDAQWMAADVVDGQATAIQSAPLGYGETSTAMLTVSGTGVLDVEYVNEGEHDDWLGRFDVLYVYVDGALRETLYTTWGSTETIQLAIASAGSHVVSFRYENGSGRTDSVATISSAEWTPLQSHTVTLNANGGTGAPATMTVLNTLSELPVAIKSGCIFAGWYTAASGGERALPGDPVSGNITLYAHWETAPFTMGGDASWFIDEDGSYRSESIAPGQAVSAEMRFTGPCRIRFDWKTDSNGSYDDGASFSIDGTYKNGIGGYMDYWETAEYAVEGNGEHVFRWVFRRDSFGSDMPGYENCVWLQNILIGSSYNVTFDPNYEGGVANVVNLFGTLGELPVLEPHGYYVFAGWFTQREGGVQVTSETPVTAAVTYYAHWTLAPYEFTGAWTASSPGIWRSPADPGSYTYSYATAEVEGPCKVSLDWSLPVSGNIALYLYADNSYVTDMDSTGSGTLEHTFESSGTHTIQLRCWVGGYYSVAPYAEISSLTVEPLPTYAVTFNPNYAGGESFTVNVLTNAAYGKLPSLLRNGYAMTGWYTAATGGEKLTADTVISGNVTYYAQWAETPFTFGGTTPWTIEDDGSMRTGPISGGSETSDASITFTGPCCVTFDWKISAQYYGRRLRYYLDEVEQETIMGQPDWASVSNVIVEAGSHTVRFDFFVYYTGYDAGEDCAWVRNFTVTPVTTSTVTFKPNYAEGGADSTVSVLQDSAIGELPVLWRDGYAMTGWYTAATGGEKLTSDTVISADATYYAQWAETDFTFSGTKPWTIEDDGSMRAGVLTQYDETSLATISVAGPCTVTFDYKVVSPNYNEYLYLDVNGTNQANYSGYYNSWNARVVNFPNAGVNTVTLRYRKTSYGDVEANYGAWIRNFVVTPIEPYVVTFDLNYPNAPAATTRNVVSGDQVGELPAPMRNGYAFEGWFTAAEGGDQVWSYRAIYENVRFYAHWVESESFDTTGGDANWTIDGDGTWRSGEVSASGATSWATATVQGPCSVSFKWKTTSYYGSLSVALDDVEQYNISGSMSAWATREIKISDDGEHVLKWTYTKNYSYGSSSDYGWVRDLVVTPVNFYSVTWINGDGSEIKTDRVEEGEYPYYSGAQPTKASDVQYTYSFSGWTPAIVAVTSNVTYTAAFSRTPREYEITWKNDDGTTIDTTSVAYGSHPTHTSPKKSGYRFVGWFTAAEGGEKLTSETTVTGAATYFAHWEEKEPGTGTFDETGGTNDIGWFVVDDGDNADSWQSGNIDHSQSTWASLDVTGPCRVTFEWKVSSEGNYDWLSFTLDDSAVDGIDRISGTVGWSEKSLAIVEGGTHTLKWTYSKDSSQDGGDDCGWVRDVTVTPIVLYTVTFDPNYGGGVTTNRTVAQGAVLGEMPSVSRAEYIFAGWFTSASGGTQVTAETIVNGNMTVYAQWHKAVITPIATFGSTGGDADWTVTDGVWCSGTITHNQSSWAQVTVTGPCDVSFKWKTSSETDYDWLKFYVDDVENDKISGTMSDWTTKSVSIDAGSHVLKWTYTKDGSQSNGSDCGWVKDLVDIRPESAAQTVPLIVIDTTKMEAPVENVDGTRTIAAKDGVTLTPSDVANVTVTSPVDSSVDITAAYTKTLDTVNNVIVVALARPEIDEVSNAANKDSEDKSGLLEDVSKIAAGKIAELPTPDTSKDEAVGALPVKMYPGLYYQAAWGNNLTNLTSGVKFRADGSTTHIGVIRQAGPRGFYKVFASEQ